MLWAEQDRERRDCRRASAALSEKSEPVIGAWRLRSDQSPATPAIPGFLALLRLKSGDCGWGLESLGFLRLLRSSKAGTPVISGAYGLWTAESTTISGGYRAATKFRTRVHKNSGAKGQENESGETAGERNGNEPYFRKSRRP